MLAPGSFEMKSSFSVLAAVARAVRYSSSRVRSLAAR